MTTSRNRILAACVGGILLAFGFFAPSHAFKFQGGSIIWSNKKFTMLRAYHKKHDYGWRCHIDLIWERKDSGTFITTKRNDYTREYVRWRSVSRESYVTLQYARHKKSGRRLVVRVNASLKGPRGWRTGASIRFKPWSKFPAKSDLLITITRDDRAKMNLSFRQSCLRY